MQVYVYGSLAYDRIMDFPGRFSDHILPDKIHILNVCFMINGLRENFGGTAGNIAYTLSLLGVRARVVATAGRDFSTYRAWLERHSVPSDEVTIFDDELTAGAYITTDLSDNQITAFNPGAMGRPSPFDPSSLAGRDCLMVIAPGNLADMARLASACRDSKTPFLFDPGQSLPAWDGAALAEALAGSLIFISNDYELELTLSKTGLTEEELAERTGTLITTRGEAGSTLSRRVSDRLEREEVPAVTPLKVSDPTGAGDAYRAGLVKGLLAPGGSLLRAARMGAVASSYAVEVYGTQTFVFDGENFAARYRDTFREELP